MHTLNELITGSSTPPNIGELVERLTYNHRLISTDALTFANRS